ncbi:class I SAM-dependent methyltransferase [bacterium]|jgi:SAM-dependent methyltransferase|nr:class I SAM-dependent methyltransferase [bacterium]
MSVVSEYFDALCKTFPEDPVKASGWYSAFTQQLRFLNLSMVGDLNGVRILDVGCGLGDLAGYLSDEGFEVDYTGVDLSGEMIRRARGRHSGLKFICKDLMDTSLTGKWDYVVASGAFSYCNDGDPYIYLDRCISRCLSLATKGVSFNCLSTYAPEYFNAKRFVYYEPDRVLKMCMDRVPYTSLSHDYLPNDFTIKMILT